MDDHEDSLHRARQAYAAQDWRGAADSFDAVAPHRLTADDLAAYADAAWWLGRVEDALRLDAAACDALVAESRPADAAGVAFRLGVFHVSRGDELRDAGTCVRLAEAYRAFGDAASAVRGLVRRSRCDLGQPWRPRR